MQQIIICKECPYFKSKCKDNTLYCNMTPKRCKELKQYNSYSKMLTELIGDIKKWTQHKWIKQAI